MRKLFAIAAIAFPALLVTGSVIVSAQTAGSINGMCAKGNTFLSAFGTPTTTPAVGSFPSCTVTAYLTGTTTLATLYQNSTLTPLTNPFTANTDGSWLLFASNTINYDIVMSGGTPFPLPAPVALTNLSVSTITSAPPPNVMSVTPNPLSFGNVPIGTTGPPLLVQLTNNTVAAVTSLVLPAAPTGTNAADFTGPLGSTCGSTLAANGGTCFYQVRCSPTLSSLETATLTITDSAGTQVQTLNCSGYSSGPPVPLNIGASPSAVNFGSVQQFVTSAPSPVTITNVGTSSGTISAIAIAGTNSSDFGQSSSCVGTILPNSSCVVSVTFTPSILGAEGPATLTITNNGSTPSLMVGLAGTGTAAASFSLSLTSAVGAQGVGTVTSNDVPPTINCSFTSLGVSGICNGNYPTGTMLTLTASPNANSALLSTVGTGSASGCSSSGSLICGPITITTNSTLTYGFQPFNQTDSLSIVFIGTGTGTVLGSANASSINCTENSNGTQSGTCNQLILAGSSVTLTATPSGTATFVNWVGISGCSSNPVCGPFSINSPIIANVNFQPGSGGVPLAKQQNCQTSVAGTSNVSCNWAAPILAGDTLFVNGEWFDNSSTVSSVTDNCGNTYTQLTGCSGSSSPRAVAAANGQSAITGVVYYAKNVNAALAKACTTAIALTASAMGRVMTGEDWAGLTTNPLDVCAGASGQDNAGSSPPGSGNITTTVPADLLLAFNDLTSGITSPATSFTQDIYNSYGNSLTFSQSRAHATSFTTATGTNTLNNSVGTGDTVTGMIISSSASDTLSSVVTSTGNNCNVVGPSTQATAGSVWLYYCNNVTGSAYPWTVTATFSGTGPTRAIWTDDFNTGGKVPTFDLSASGSGTTGTAVNTPTITPTNGNSFLYCGAMVSTGVSTVNSPWTAGAFGLGTNVDFYQLSASGGQAVNLTAISSGPWASICLSLSPGTGGSNDLEERPNVSTGGSPYVNAVTPSSTTNNWASFLSAWKVQTTTSPSTIAVTITTTANGSGTVTGGSLNCIITNGVLSATGCSVTIPINSALAITASPASGSTFTGYNGGGCGVNPLCNIPTSQTGVNLNIVANFSLSSAYTYTSQEPVIPVAFSSNAQSIFYKPLPGRLGTSGNWLNHLQGNTSTPTVSNAFGQCLITNCGAQKNNGIGSPSSSLWGFQPFNSYGNYNSTAKYYAQAGDPWWIVNGCFYCGTEAGWTIEFQGPNNFLLPGGNSSGQGGDSSTFIWQQASGNIVDLYFSGGSSTGETRAGVCPSNSHQGTFADPCTIPITWSALSWSANYYTSRDWQAQNQAGSNDLGSSIGIAPLAAQVRTNELTSGNIPHVRLTGVPCIKKAIPFPAQAAIVFPANASPGICGTSGFPSDSTYRPYAGMLYAFDYTPAQLDCLDPAKATCTYSDSTPIAKVYDFQMVWIRENSNYGVIPAETSGNDGSQTLDYNVPYGFDDYATSWQFYFELGQQVSPFNSPLWAYLQNAANETGATSSGTAFCGGARTGTNASQKYCYVRAYSNIPLLPGLSGLTDINGNSCTSTYGCDASGHLQAVDQCVLIAQAGLSSYKGVNGCP
jgi:hypothetical protein